MSQQQILVLGAIAGLTIFLGLPAGRLRRLSTRTSTMLSAVATGILVFLFWDVISAGIEPVEAALNAAAIDHDGSWGRFAWLATIFVGCFLVGLMTLVYFDQMITRRRRRDGFMSLAIGQSAASGAIDLALVLVIGFGLHNATEGFGIVGPFAGTQERPSWGFLALVGLIGGGPTFFGTLLGQAWVNEAVSIAFLALAAGSILYVVIELLGVCSRLGHKTIVAWGIALGLILGFATDFVLVAAGA